ncbi:response regulator [Herbiconiux flava]|uniref:DNA-binding NarL/FixJ family response regulator n=1 Tax=Herbiconiux flava TaxID=881268 RepID=A0A852SM17_9MICO|nr:response regulator transcription factor [Herbiconiux flava]NYD68847.1 DNA-binding NarL/FixJ family response regulator [Herbiconiux flava]GLK15588.1 DNA-binding response regulator [Herbiconiux flava]
MRPVGVALIDDHPLVRAGLVALLEEAGGIAVVGEASDGGDALALIERTRPDVLLMDLSMPGTGGIEATGIVRREHPELAVVILTSSHTGDDLRAALAAGATGYVVKDAEPAEIAAAVQAAARGHRPIDPRVTHALLPEAGTASARPGDADEPQPIRGREAEVLTLLARGLANKQIAHELGIAERTVKVHVGSIFRRLGVGDRVSAALWARENGY